MQEGDLQAKNKKRRMMNKNITNACRNDLKKTVANIWNNSNAKWSVIKKQENLINY